MTVAVIILVFLLILFLSVWSMVRSRPPRSGDWRYLNTKQSEVDIEVLTLLLSRSESEYLRKFLPVREFRRIKRQRLALARTYLRTISRNTADFIRAAEAVKASDDAKVEQAAHELLSIAFRIRLNVPIVQFCLMTEWLFPGLSLVAPRKLNVYRELVGRIVFVLQRLPSAEPAIESAS
jgi:hypothetical protein